MIEPEIVDRNRDQITVDKNNIVFNSPKLFLHYQKNNNGNFNVVYTKNHIGAKSYNNNKIWVLLNPEKDTIYNVVNKQKLELDAIVDLYEVKNKQKKDSYLCIVNEILCENGIVDTLGIVINPNTLEPLFVYSANVNLILPVITSNESKKLFKCPVSVNFRLKYTIEKVIANQIKENKSSKERYAMLEKVIKKQSDRV